jgi:hypothetical protein
VPFVCLSLGEPKETRLDIRKQVVAEMGEMASTEMAQLFILGMVAL